MGGGAPRAPRGAPSRDASSDWSSDYDSDAGSDYSSGSWDSADDEERRRRGCRGCCSRSARPASSKDGQNFGSKRSSVPTSSSSWAKGEEALARKLQDVAAVDDLEVPTTLWTRPSRSLAMERAETLQPRFKARPGAPRARRPRLCTTRGSAP